MTENEIKTLVKLLDDIKPVLLKEITGDLTNKIISKLSKSLLETENILHKQNIKNELEFILWNDLWNNYGIYGDKRDNSRNNSANSLFGKGRLLYLDYGQHNIGVEFSFSHMGIVLKDFKSLIVVVPVTSDKGQIYSDEIENSIIRVKKKDYKQFNENSIILIHQVQSLSKNRINRYLGQSINKTPLMAEIEEKLSAVCSPYVFGNKSKQIKNLESIIDNQKQRIEYLEKITEEQNLNELKRISCN